MNKFFVTAEIKKERLNICKSCEYYFTPTGSCKICKCFMYIKTALATQSCPQNYWTKTTEVKTPEVIPEYLIEELIDVWKNIKNKTATNEQYKQRAVELYNTIYNTNYKTTTNCSSCLQSVWSGLNNVIKKLEL